MLGDPVLWSGLALGVGILLGIHLGPALAPTWYPRVLRAWGRKRNVRIDFVLDPGRRLREGPEIEVVLGQLYVRQLSSIGIGVVALSLSSLLLLHGPHLSESTANSLAVAGLPLLATGCAAILLRGFLDAYRPDGGSPRPAGAEDYVWPVTRAVAWVTAGASVLVPLGAGVLAAGPTYAGDKLFWEGLVAGPLAATGLVVALERWLRSLSDSAQPGDPMLYVWDCLRARAVQILLGFAFVNAVLGFTSARGALRGVALVGPDPSWLDQVTTICWLLQVLASLGFMLVVVQPLGTRLRGRLWPDVPATERIEFGRTIPIP